MRLTSISNSGCASRIFLFYAGFAGEARSADYNMMPRSAPIKSRKPSAVSRLP